MSHFTELNLQGKQDPKPGQNATKTSQPLSAPGAKPGDVRPADKPKPKTNHSDSEKLSNMQKRMALIGSMAAVALIAVTFVETSGCSKAANNSEAPAPMAAAQTPTAPAPVTAAPAPTPAPVKKAVKKTARRIPTATYKNSDYGISFRYPTYDSFKDGVWTSVESLPMNFSQPGGTALGTVELPGDMYPGTDYASAFFSASVNSALTEEQCTEFSSNDASDGAKATPHKVKLGSTEYSEIEVLAGESQQADAKYYHTFQNGNCYEFALGLQTSGSDATDNSTPVKRSQVFPHLEWMLSTVAIKPASTPEVAASTTSQSAAPESKTSDAKDSAVNTSETKAPDAVAPAAQTSQTQTSETQAPEVKAPEAKVVDGSK